MNERTSTYVTHTETIDGIDFQYATFGGKPEETARSLIAQGRHRVEIITEVTRWRGVNGKRTKEIISRTPVTA